MYGVRESPRWWAQERDGTIRNIRIFLEGIGHAHLLQSTADDNLWMLVVDDGSENPTVLAKVVTYVDDFMITSQHREVGEALIQKLADVWELSSVDCISPIPGDGATSSTFCGYDLQYVHICEGGKKEAVLKVSQTRYVQQMLESHGMTSCNTAPTPAEVEASDPEEEEKPEPHLVKEAQGIVGEIGWVANRSRPDIAYAFSRAASCTSSKPRRAVKLAKRILRYLKGTSEYAMFARPWREDDKWCSPLAKEIAEGLDRARAEIPESYERAHDCVLRTSADASFAPKAGRSHGGIICYLGSMPISWRSSRQNLVAESSCEAEVVTQSEALQLGMGLVAAIREMGVDTEHDQVTDSRATLLQVAGGGSWRSRHYSIRSRSIMSKVQHGYTALSHCPGVLMKADVLTKALGPEKHRRAVEMLHVKEEDVHSTFDIVGDYYEEKEEINIIGQFLECSDSEAEVGDLYMLEGPDIEDLHDDPPEVVARPAVISEAMAEAAMKALINLGAGAAQRMMVEDKKGECPVMECQECPVLEEKDNSSLAAGMGLVAGALAAQGLRWGHGYCCRRRRQNHEEVATSGGAAAQEGGTTGGLGGGAVEEEGSVAPSWERIGSSPSSSSASSAWAPLRHHRDPSVLGPVLRDFGVQSPCTYSYVDSGSTKDRFVYLGHKAVDNHTEVGERYRYEVLGGQLVRRLL